MFYYRMLMLGVFLFTSILVNNDLTNGFAFGVSEAGVQRAGIESNGDKVQ